MGILCTHPRSCDLPLYRIVGPTRKVDRVIAAVFFPWFEPADLKAVTHELDWVYFCRFNLLGKRGLCCMFEKLIISFLLKQKECSLYFACLEFRVVALLPSCLLRLDGLVGRPGLLSGCAGRSSSPGGFPGLVSPGVGFPPLVACRFSGWGVSS